MKKKVLSLFLVAAMGVSMLVGCGGGNDKPSGGDTQAGNDQQGDGTVKEVTLTVWAPDNQQELLKTQQKAFEEAHPEYKITWKTSQVGEGDAKTMVLNDPEAAADVFFYANDQVQELVEAGAIARLGGAAEEMVTTTMPESVYNTVKVGDALYGIPFTHNLYFLYYDKSVLGDVDVTSLDAIIAAPTEDGVANFAFDTGSYKIGSWYYGAGLTVFGEDGSDLAAGCDWNSETGVAVTKKIIEVMNNPKVDTSHDPMQLADERTVGAWITGGWDYATYKEKLGDDLGVATLPSYDLNGQKVQLRGFYGTKAIGVSAQSKNLALAIEFATYLGSEEQQLARFEKSGQIPVNTNASQNEVVQADELAAVTIAESDPTYSVNQPTAFLFSSRYWGKADLIAPAVKNGELKADNAQEWLDKVVDAMCAE